MWLLHNPTRIGPLLFAAKPQSQVGPQAEASAGRIQVKPAGVYNEPVVEVTRKLELPAGVLMLITKKFCTK